VQPPIIYYPHPRTSSPQPFHRCQSSVVRCPMCALPGQEHRPDQNLIFEGHCVILFIWDSAKRAGAVLDSVVSTSTQGFRSPVSAFASSVQPSCTLGTTPNTRLHRHRLPLWIGSENWSMKQRTSICFHVASRRCPCVPFPGRRKAGGLLTTRQFYLHHR